MQAQFPYLVAGCAVALASALGVVLSKRPVHSAVSLLVHSLSLAALYLLLSAEFVAMAQMIIYSGAIVVLFLFVVLLLPHGGRESKHAPGRLFASLLGGATLLSALVFVIGQLTLPASEPMASAGSTGIGHSLFGPLLVPLELTTLPMLLAIIGAVTIWRRQEHAVEGGAR